VLTGSLRSPALVVLFKSFNGLGFHRTALTVFRHGGVCFFIGKGYASASLRHTKFFRRHKEEMSQTCKKIRISTSDPGHHEPLPSNGECSVTTDGERRTIWIWVTYERSSGRPMSRANNFTTAVVYEEVLRRSGRG